MAAKALSIPRTKRKAKAVKAKAAKRNPVFLPLRKVFARREAAVKRGEYEILGQVMLLRTEKGDIDYVGNGPYLAQLDSDKSLFLMNEWQGFPSLVEATSELCPDCKAHCTACDGKGERLCMGLQCGGYGKMILNWQPCPAEGCQKLTGSPDINCAECGGSGRVVGQTAECPACKGTKVNQCPECRGSGKMSTGRKDGAPRESREMCESCQGTTRVLKREAQDYKEFTLGVLEGFTAIGPIHEILLRADVCRDAQRSLELGSVYTDKEGNLAALLVKNPDATGQPQYLLGGTFELRKL